MRQIAPILLALLMVGCSTTAKDFNRGLASEDQFDRDAAGCEMESYKATATGTGGLGAISNRNTIFDACMRSKGYKRN
jgi:hypothetical protein